MGEEKVLYSVKMRSSLGGAHGVGGQHISGAERIVTKNSVEQEMISMLHRAWEHDGGAADFIQFKVEAVRHEGITCCPLLPLYQIDTETKEEGRAAAKRTAPFRSQRNCYRKRICYFGIADRRYARRGSR